MSYVDMAVGRVAGEKKALASDRGLTALDALVSGIWYLVYCTGPIAYPIVNGYSPSGGAPVPLRAVLVIGVTDFCSVVTDFSDFFSLFSCFLIDHFST